MRFTSLALAGLMFIGIATTTSGCTGGHRKSTTSASTVSASTSATTGGSTTASTTSSSTAGATSTVVPGGLIGMGAALPGGGAATTSGGNTSSGSAASGSTSAGFQGGTGRFVDGTASLPDSTTADWGADASDLDGDGDVDIAIAVYNGPPRILFNDGARFAERAGAIPTTAFAGTSVRLVDLDKDGDLDLVFTANAQPSRTFVNSGRGVFTAGQQFNTTNDCFTYNAAIGDANKDGWPDVYLAQAGKNAPSLAQDKLYLNDKTGRLVEAPAGSLPALSDDSMDATFLDVNGDGNLDIFVANFGSPHAVLVNDGTGKFLNQGDRYLPVALTRNGTAIAQGDVDGDGKTDLFITNEGPSVNGALPAGEKNTLLLQTTPGARYADASTRLPSDAEASFKVRLVDVNGDGKLDVIVSQLRAVQRLYLNQNGVLVDATANFPTVNATPYDSLGLTIGDFNGDRAPDVFITRRGRKPWLFLNTR